MVKTMTIAAAIVAAASVLAFSGGALAQTGSANAPTQGDFDLCNQEAQGSSPGASTLRPDLEPRLRRLLAQGRLTEHRNAGQRRRGIVGQ